MAKIKFLGTGGSEGWPAPYCECKYCKEARKLGGKNLRSRASILIGDSLLIDLNPDLHMQSINYGLPLDKIKDILITHAHLDHLDVETLTKRRERFIDLPDKELNIWLKEEIGAILNNRLQCLDNISVSDLDKVNLKHIKSNEKFHIGQAEILPLIANHNKLGECLNFVIKYKNKTIYLGYDTGFPLKETFEYLKKIKLDVAIFDCTFGKKDSKTVGNDYHMGINDIKEVKDILYRYNTIIDKTLILATHFSHIGELLHEGLKKNLKPHNIIPAFDGMEIDL